jgi:septum formation protein
VRCYLARVTSTGLLLLASASPRRRDILRTLGLAFEATSVDADETEREGELPADYLDRVVAAKLALARPLAKRGGYRGVVVADTTVVLGVQMLAKPADDEDNRRMVRALAGRTHEVMTRFAVASDDAEHAQTVVTEVTFRELTDDEIARYVASGEGRDKAGGYAIQGLGSFAVMGIRGSYANVVGLPACELVQALCALGLVSAFPLVGP